MAKSKPGKPGIKAKKSELIKLDWPFNTSRTLWVMMGLMVIVSIFVFWKFISGRFLFIFDDTGSDSIALFYPNLVHMAMYYREVGFPGWSFFLGLGQAFYPGGLLNPWDWIYLPMGPKSIAIAIIYVQWMKLLASGFIFGLFLKKLGVESPVILIGSLLYAFGGYMVVGSGWYIHTTHIFWFTVAILAVEMLLRDQKWWLVPIPFIFLAGTRAYFLVLFMIVYGAVRTLDYYQGDYKKLFRIYGRLIFCGIIALLITAPFIGAKFVKLYNSPRVSGNVSKMESLSATPIFEMGNDKHNATAILRWFSNDIIGTDEHYVGFRNYLEGPMFYIGLITLLLLPQFFWMANRRQRWLYGLFLGVWLWLILFPWFRYAFYAFAGNYYKGALSLFIPFSALLIALMALNKMVKGQKPNLLLLAVTLISLLAVLWFPYSSVKDGINTNIQLIVSLFLGIETMVLAMMHTAGFRKWALPVLAGIVAIEAGTISYISYIDRHPIPAADLGKPVRHFDDSQLALDFIRQQQNESFYRTEKAYGSVKSGFNDALVQGFFGSKTYQSHNNKYYIRFLEETGVIPKSNQASSRWLVGVTQRNTLHPLASVKYMLATPESRDKVNQSIYQLEKQTGNVEVYRNKYFIPFGIPFTRYFTESEFLKLENNEKIESYYYGVVVPDDKVQGVRGVEKGDLAAFTFGGGMAQTWEQLRDKAMKMTSFTQNHIQGTIDVEQSAVVFFSLPYDNAWQVYIDGVRRDLLLVDLGFSGVKVENGTHQIELKYVPPLSRTGWIYFGIGLGVYLWLAIRKVNLFPIRMTA